MEKVKLVNNIDTIIKINKNTPRIALCFYFAINEPEKKAGVYTLMNRLFMQGTHSRTAEEIAESLEGNAIECTSEMKYDYFKFRLLCLNEDFEKGLEILSDIIKNSTFKDLNKEVFKIKGELTAELDSPKTSASDNFYKTIFKNHFYGNTYTKILENVDNIEINDIEEAYKNVILNSHKTITVVGDKDQQEIIGLLEKYFSGLTQDTENKNSIVLLETQKKEVVKIEKNDAAQAQVLQGWIVPTRRMRFVIKIVFRIT